MCGVRMTFPDSPTPRGRRAIVSLVVGALLVYGCSLLNARQRGEYDTLEAEAAAQIEAMESIFEDALGEYATSGTTVRVGPCGEGSPLWSIDTGMIVKPALATPEEGVETIIAELEGRGLEVGEVEAANGLRPDYQVDIGFFGPLHFYWSTRPEPGILLGVEGSCYSSDRVDAEDPWSLNVEEGQQILVYE